MSSLHANIQDTLGFLSAVKTYVLEVYIPEQWILKAMFGLLNAVPQGQ